MKSSTTPRTLTLLAASIVTGSYAYKSLVAVAESQPDISQRTPAQHREAASAVALAVIAALLLVAVVVPMLFTVQPAAKRLQEVTMASVIVTAVSLYSLGMGISGVVLDSQSGSNTPTNVTHNSLVIVVGLLLMGAVVQTSGKMKSLIGGGRHRYRM